MATQKQIDANRRNAERSTGPRTAAGRAKSSRNSLNHGLTAEQLTVLDEKPEDLEQFCRELWDAFAPADAVEEEWVRQVTLHWWCGRRGHRSEAKLLTLGGEGDDLGIGGAFHTMAQQVDLVSRYQTAHHRAAQRALNNLERSQERRRGGTVLAPIAVDITGPDSTEAKAHHAPPLAVPTASGAADGDRKAPPVAPPPPVQSKRHQLTLDYAHKPGDASAVSSDTAQTPAS